MIACSVGNGAQNKKNYSDNRKLFKTGDCRELGCSKPRRFALGKVGKCG